jgi:hypothetical protein
LFNLGNCLNLFRFYGIAAQKLLNQLSIYWLKVIIIS